MGFFIRWPSVGVGPFRFGWRPRRRRSTYQRPKRAEQRRIMIRDRIVIGVGEMPSEFKKGRIL